MDGQSINHKRNITVVAILMCLGFSSFGSSFQEVKSDSLIELPEWEIADWHYSHDIDLDYRIYTALDPNTLIFRDYVNDRKTSVNLALVYHQNNRWGAHDPIICYKSQGWKITEAPHDISFPYSSGKLKLKRFIVTKGEISSLVYYCWFSSNKKLTASRNKQMWDMVINGILYGYSESGFIRFSVTLDPLNEAQNIKDLDDFTRKFINTFNIHT